jgi:lipopolysaccharide transport system ATP-binding protein
MSDIAIDIECVSKEFLLEGLGDYHRLTEAFAGWIRSKLSRSDAQPSTPTARRSQVRRFVALDQVSLQIKRGETIGIVGSNGAGKSTLLKILSKIVTPTSGRVGIGGRVGCLLEVGTGFHPELTGRENVFLNGAILGMPRREIRKRFDQIVAFAEVEDFLDIPVKRYSNGMLIRLGFSVAAHLDPDVLIIDEVLGVGDADFQKKSLDKAREFREEGRTVLMVSHNLPMIASFCNRAVLLRAGKLVADGLPSDVIDKHLSGSGKNELVRSWITGDQTIATDYLSIERIDVASDDGTRSPSIAAPINVDIQYKTTKQNQKVCFQLTLSDESGGRVLKSVSPTSDNTLRSESWMEHGTTGTYVCRCQIQANLLNARRYVVGLLIGEDANRVDRTVDALLSFTVHDDGTNAAGTNVDWIGFAVRPQLKWSMKHVAKHVGETP